MATPAASAAPSLATFTRLLREDVAHAREHLVLTALVGSPFVPRVLRQVALRLSGARVESAPGPGFSLTGDPRNLSVARGVFFNRGTTIEAIAPVTIGANAAIGMQVLIMTSHHAIDADGRWSDTPTGRPVVIEDRVWIGGRATVLPGAHIEHDVVVAAGAVVTGRLLAHGVYAGVPAKRIRDLAGADPTADRTATA